MPAMHRTRPGRPTMRVLLRVFLLALLTVVALGVAPPRAARMCFATQEYLRRIQDVAITGANGEALSAAQAQQRRGPRAAPAAVLRRSAPPCRPSNGRPADLTACTPGLLA